jgi:hypothetical protein
LPSEASNSARAQLEPGRAGVEVYTEDGAIDVDTSLSLDDRTTTRIVDEFVDTVERHRPHPLDVHRGLHLQRLLATAAEDMA